jgi:hypothetical protein
MSLCTGQHCLIINRLGTANDQAHHFRRTAAWAMTDLASQVAALQALLQDASHALCDMSRRTALPANAGTVVRRTGLRGLTTPCNPGGILVHRTSRTPIRLGARRASRTMRLAPVRAVSHESSPKDRSKIRLEAGRCPRSWRLAWSKERTLNMSQNAQASIRRRHHRQRNDVCLPRARFHHMRAEEVEVWGAFRGAASRVGHPAVGSSGA